MDTDKPIYSPDQIMARVETIKKVRESWKGAVEYAETIDMEIWALTIAAELLKASRAVVVKQACDKGMNIPGALIDRMAMQACERVSEIV